MTIAIWLFIIADMHSKVPQRQARRLGVQHAHRRCFLTIRSALRCRWTRCMRARWATSRRASRRWQMREWATRSRSSARTAWLGRENEEVTDIASASDLAQCGHATLLICLLLQAYPWHRSEAYARLSGQVWAITKRVGPCAGARQRLRRWAGMRRCSRWCSAACSRPRRTAFRTCARRWASCSSMTLR